MNYPLQYFAARIGGDRVDATLPAIAGDPANWQPVAADIAEYQAADLVLLNGANYAKWVGTATLPTSRLVDTSAGFADRLITVEGTVTHSHGPEGDHSHGETAVTTWLDPKLAAEQARAIHRALVAASPFDAAAFDAGLASLESDLDALDLRLKEVFGGGVAEALIGSHPVYQYLAAAYGVDIPSVHLEPDQPPTQREWQGLEEAIAERDVVVMLWEGTPAAETRERIEAWGVAVSVYDPSANTPDSGDWLSVMTANAESLASSLERMAPPGTP